MLKPRKINKELSISIKEMSDQGMGVSAIHKKLKACGISVCRATVHYHAFNMAKIRTGTAWKATGEAMNVVEKVTKENDDIPVKQIQKYKISSLSTIGGMRRNLGRKQQKVRSKSEGVLGIMLKPRKINKELSISIKEMSDQGMRVSAIHKKLKACGISVCRATVHYHAFNMAKIRTGTAWNATGEAMKVMEKVTKENEEITANQIQKIFATEYKENLSLSTIRWMRRNLGRKQQKVRHYPIISDSNKDKRVLQAQKWLKSKENFNDVIFTDQTTITLERFPGQALKQRNPLKVHAWAAISRIGAGPLVIFEGTMDKDFFKENIVDNSLAPYIGKHWASGHRLFQDNTARHVGTGDYLEQCGINWQRTPPQSPEFNAMKSVWGKLKDFISTTAKPKSKVQLVRAIEDFWNEVLTVEMCNESIDNLYKVLPVIVKRKGQPTNL